MDSTFPSNFPVNHTAYAGLVRQLLKERSETQDYVRERKAALVCIVSIAWAVLLAS